MHKTNKKGEIQTCLKIVAQLAVTSEKGVVFNPVRSGSRHENVADNSSCSYSNDDNSMLDIFNGQQLGIKPCVSVSLL